MTLGHAVAVFGVPDSSPWPQSPPAHSLELQRSQLPAGNEHCLENTKTMRKINKAFRSILV